MIIISHRGNTQGPDTSLENSPDYIKCAKNIGFDVEIDVWCMNNFLYLGHDTPVHSISESFLHQEGLWCHAKNYEALEYMKLNSIKNYFWHETDKYTITSAGYIWCFPGYAQKNGILVHKEKYSQNMQVLGICTDYPLSWRI